MGEWQLFDLGSDERAPVLGKGALGWTALGTAGLNYDPARETLTGNVGAINTLNAAVFDSGAVVDQLFYRVGIVNSVSITPDLQFVFDPANNPEDGVVFVPGIRLLLDF